MNPLSAVAGFFANFLFAGSQEAEDRKQGGAAGAAYEKWLNDNGYPAQYKAYLKAHNGSSDGFVYKDPGDYPG